MQLSPKNTRPPNERPPPYCARDGPPQEQREAGSAKADADDSPWPPKDIDLSIMFLPDPMDPWLNNAAWEADVDVVAKDVPRLMREGFHWNEANIQREKGHMVLRGLPPIPRSRGWSYARVFYLTDKPRDGGDAQWTATLTVFARKLSVLSNFKPRQISLGNVHSAWAWNRDKKLTYSYYAIRPGDSFNTIYDDRPLEGWWPWPKKRQSPLQGCCPWL
ncbi:hypothetical protein HRG_001258 [Hirsutella rhossiliensis]|uniref:Uncharacterized protein n=1 Tax=Hirsutella rhossiliensis TaxID=111463 RepID=A0A9P8SPW1_9HYPO|nr:uncharacterized protein HRG_01258 [Hirsutella rhossiliensis]KAH0968616.1 hypothetical protein HRG_01258 [Hirsutella rhossiliensis]